MKKQKTEVDKVLENLAQPTYEFVVEEGSEDITPVQRKIAKTMKVTETFKYYDALKYVMQLEKAVIDKQDEINGLKSMIKAYRDEIALIDKLLNVDKMDRAWNLEKHRKLKQEEVEALIAEKPSDPDTV